MGIQKIGLTVKSVRLLTYCSHVTSQLCNIIWGAYGRSVEMYRNKISSVLFITEYIKQGSRGKKECGNQEKQRR